MSVTTILLALAILAVWLPPLRVGRVALPPSLVVLPAATIAGLTSGQLDWRGAVAVAVLVALACAAKAARSFAWLWSVAAVCLAFSMAIKLVPGFAQVVFLQGVRVSEDAPAMRLTFHFDAGVAALVLALFFCRRAQSASEILAVIKRAAPLALVTTAAVIGLAWAVGFLRFDPKFPSFAWAHLLKVLLWTAVLEEAFFRGIVQDRLASWRFIATRPQLRWLPLSVASILFGLVHFPGGWTYVALATLAGVGYGAAYARTGRLEGAIAAHFLLNAAHFVGFTYPNLLRG